jgi:hypothetical protein
VLSSSSSRRLSFSGAVGAVIACRCFGLKWIERVGGSRALTVTAAGRRGLMSTFGLSV